MVRNSSQTEAVTVPDISEYRMIELGVGGSDNHYNCSTIFPASYLLSNIVKLGETTTSKTLYIQFEFTSTTSVSITNNGSGLYWSMFGIK